MSDQRKHEKVYEDLTERVIELMRDNPEDWKRPWVSNATRPQNAVSGHIFTGGNWLWLTLLGHERGYTNNLWATYKQWQSIGAQVQGGETGVKLIRVATLFRCDAEDCDTKGKCSRHPDQRRVVKYPTTFTAFHSTQVEGFDVPEPETFDHDPIDEADGFFDAIGAERQDGMAAFYTPATDRITLPPRETFREAEGFYATLAHEHVHWTSHEDRLDRKVGGAFGSDEYGREELVAELGSVFVMNDLGIEAEPANEHGSYLASWIETLQEEPSYLWHAASDAQRAATFLRDAAESGGYVTPRADTETEEAHADAA